MTDLVAGDRVTIEWADWAAAAPPSPDAPSVTDATRDRIATFLVGVLERKIAARREAVGDIADPADILLQLRTGAQGGHHSSVSLGDPGNWNSVRVGEASLDVTRTLTDRQGPTAYVRGGFIPAGQALVIESVDAYANAQGDNNGDGAAIPQIGRQRLLELHDGEGPVADWFDGVITLEMNDPEWMTGRKTKTKMLVRQTEEGQGIVTMLGPPGADGKSSPAMRLTYTKKAE